LREKYGRVRVIKWDCITFQSFCTTKQTVPRVKKQPTEQKAVPAGYSLDEALISRIYKEIKKLNIKRTTN
jgi:hypothetical protein